MVGNSSYTAIPCGAACHMGAVRLESLKSIRANGWSLTCKLVGCKVEGSVQSCQGRCAKARTRKTVARGVRSKLSHSHTVSCGAGSQASGVEISSFQNSFKVRTWRAVPSPGFKNLASLVARRREARPVISEEGEFPSNPSTPSSRASLPPHLHDGGGSVLSLVRCS